MTSANPQTSLFASTSSPGPGRLIVRFAGPTIGQREVPIITDIVASAMESVSGGGASLNLLVLDFSQVTFVNSMGLGMCIDFRNRAVKLGAKAAIIAANPELTSLFKMVRLEKLFTFAKSADDLR